MSYTVKEVSDLFALPAHTLRYYESEGLLPAIERLDNGRRAYGESDLRRIRMILCMREAGMSVESIKAFNALDPQDAGTLGERRAIIAEQKAEVVRKIGELRELERLLDRKLEDYDGRLRQLDA